MAQRTITTFYSDLSGTEIKDGTGRAILFAVDGNTYEIDLTDAEHEDLRKALAAYVAVARKVPAHSVRGASGPTPNGDPPATVIRDWARNNGHDVPLRGRIPAPAVEAYRATH